MRLRRPGVLVVAIVAFAAAVAVVGAAVNLHLLRPQPRSEAPAVLSLTIERSTTTSETTGPPSTATEPSTTPTSTVPPTTSPTTTGEPSLRRTYAVGDSGTVEVAVRAGVLVVESVTPSAGWSYAIDEQRADEVEISFRRVGAEGESSFHASLHDDELRVEIEGEDGESPDD